MKFEGKNYIENEKNEFGYCLLYFFGTDLQLVAQPPQFQKHNLH